MRSLLALLFFIISGCSTAGGLLSNRPLEVHSMGLERVILKPDCSTIVCTNGFANEGDIWMTDIPLELLESGEFQDGLILHFQVLWTPLAGKTPLASTSTNLSIKLFIVSDGEVGIYGGGGYCWLSGNPEDGMTLYIEDATIAIQTQGDRFADLLTPATMLGKVHSIADPMTAHQIANAAALLR